MAEKHTIINNEGNHRFEMPLAGDTAYLQYRVRGDTLELLFIFVPPGERGKGLSGPLIHYALDFAKERGLKMEVFCSYIRRYLEVKGIAF